MGCVSLERSLLGDTVPGCAVCRLFGDAFLQIEVRLGVQSQAVQSADCLDTYGGAFLQIEIRLGVQFRLCSL